MKEFSVAARKMLEQYYVENGIIGLSGADDDRLDLLEAAMFLGAQAAFNVGRIICLTDPLLPHSIVRIAAEAERLLDVRI